MMASLLLKGVADPEEARMARRSPSLTLSIKGSDNCCPWPTAIYHLVDLKYSDPLVPCTEPFVSPTVSTGAVQYDGTLSSFKGLELESPTKRIAGHNRSPAEKPQSGDS